MTDETGTEIDADVFEELVQAGNLTVRVATDKSTGETQTCEARSGSSILKSFVEN